MNEEKMLKRRYGQCDVTIIFKGSNPTLKSDLLVLLCDSFEDRIMNNNKQTEEPAEKE